MSIKLDHVTQELSVTDQTKPFTLNAPGGLLIKTVQPAEREGVIAYDYHAHVLKYRNDSKWVILGSASDFNGKARKLNAEDFGGTGGTSSKYLSVVGSIPTWQDPVVDGFVRFNGGPVTLSAPMTFDGAVTFKQSINCNNNAVTNIVSAGANDAVPRSYVDAKINTATNNLVADLNLAYSDLVTRYQLLITEIYNEAFPAPPVVPPPVVPPIVVPPEPPKPPNPPRLYNLRYTVRVLGATEVAYAIGAWCMEQATLENKGVSPAVGSTIYVTYMKKTGASVPKAGTVYYDAAYFARFAVSDKVLTVVEEGKL